MPKISKSGVAALDSLIRRLAAYAEKAEQAGKKVYYLNIGQPDIPTTRAALEKVLNSDLTILNK